MGYKHMKRPLDLRTKAATDFKADIGTVNQLRRTTITASTAASTALATRGVIAMSATSTANGGQSLYTLTTPTSGEELVFVVASAGASSYTFKVNSTGAPFGSLAGTDLTQIQITAVAGAMVSLLGASTARWYVTAHNGATFTTATG